MKNLFGAFTRTVKKVVTSETLAAEVAKLAAKRAALGDAITAHESNAAATIAALTADIAKVRALREQL